MCSKRLVCSRSGSELFPIDQGCCAYTHKHKGAVVPSGDIACTPTKLNTVVMMYRELHDFNHKNNKLLRNVDPTFYNNLDILRAKSSQLNPLLGAINQDDILKFECESRISALLMNFNL